MHHVTCSKRHLLAIVSITYTGREWDKETGLYYYRARYYDPIEGRFISKDPIGFAGGDVNLFGYVGNKQSESYDSGYILADCTCIVNVTCHVA